MGDKWEGAIYFEVLDVIAGWAVAWGEGGDTAWMSSVIECTWCGFTQISKHKTADAYAGYATSRRGEVLESRNSDITPSVTLVQCEYFWVR